MRTLAYTNHTLLPEALEKWPVELFETLIPRHLEIIYEINRRFLDDVRRRYPGDEARVQRMSLIEEEPARRVRMAHLAVVGSHSTNGVAAIHSDLLRTRVLQRLRRDLPGALQQQDQRRHAAPLAAAGQSRAVAAHHRHDRRRLGHRPVAAARAAAARRRRRLPRAVSRRQARRQARLRRLAASRRTGRVVDPDSIFDSQIKRIHEYKRQLLNVLHIVILYNRLRAQPAVRR